MQPTAEEMAAAGGMPSMYVQPAHVQGPPPPLDSGHHTPTSGIGGASTGGDVASDGGALESLIGAIRWQVEYYFSVENLVKDVYLRNLMNGEGFVAVSKVGDLKAQGEAEDASLSLVWVTCHPLSGVVISIATSRSLLFT